MSSTSNTALNNFILNNREHFTISNFNTNVDRLNTTKLEDTVFSYSRDLGVLFCLECCINLTTLNYIQHLKKRHIGLYKSYRSTTKLELLNTRIESLEYSTLDSLKDKLSYNQYYIKELPLLFNNYKCKECLFVNIDRKSVRNHYNKEHPSIDKLKNQEASYIIESLPLQLLQGFKNNAKVYFIPKLPIIEARRSQLNLLSTRISTRSNSLSSNSSN